MSFGFFLKEAIRALKRNAVPSFAAMATVLVTVLILGVFIPMVQATTGAANEVRGKVIADVYLKDGVKQADIDRTTGARRLKEVDLWEISLVTFPMLPGARVSGVKLTSRGPCRTATASSGAKTKRRYQR